MRPKTILILLLVVAAAAVVVIPTLRKQRRETAASERHDLDVEISRYYDQTAKPLLGGVTKEPARAVGKLLPVAVKNALPPEPDAALDAALYKELDPALRTDRLADAGTIVFVASEGTAMYKGGENGLATVSDRLTITLFDPATKSVLGTKRFDAGELPTETNQDGLDYVGARLAARMAAYLKSLPR